MVLGVPLSLERSEVCQKDGLSPLGFKQLGGWGEILANGLPKEPRLNYSCVSAVRGKRNSELSFHLPENVNCKWDVLWRLNYGIF